MLEGGGFEEHFAAFSRSISQRFWGAFRGEKKREPFFFPKKTPPAPARFQSGQVTPLFS
jgi:hypothetical protein